MNRIPSYVASAGRTHKDLSEQRWTIYVRGYARRAYIRLAHGATPNQGAQ